MSSSSVIGNMQSALDCAGKCDCCDKLQSQINALKQQIANLSNLTESDVRRIAKQLIDETLNPKVKEIEYKLLGVESTANNAQSTANTSVDAVEEMYARYDKLTGRVNTIYGYSQEALKQSGTATNEAAKATAKAVNTANEVNGLKGLIDGLKGRIGQLGDAISKAEALAGDAITKAAKAIGISEQALGATARLGAKILEIFNIISTIFTLIEQLETLRILGDRIDAVENGLLKLGNDVSGILGKLLGIQNRINEVAGQLPGIRDIANQARLIGEGAARLAGSAQVTAERAQNFAQVANGNASQAQVTADGAVRNAAQANANATTAYQKAAEAQLTANRAENKASSAYQKGIEALGVATVALTLVQLLKLRPGIPGRDGLNGRNGLDGRNGLNGRDGITTIIQLPGIPGRDGRDGAPGRNGFPGRSGSPGIPGRNGKDGINGINGKDGRDGVVNPAETASLRALIIQQHTQTRANSTIQHQGTRGQIQAFVAAALAPILFICKQILDLVSKAGAVAQTALLTIINNKLGNQVVGGIGGLITRVAENSYLDKVLNVLTFAATMHNALMLSNNLGQTLISIIDQILGFILPKGIDGTPINFGETLGKAAHEIIADTIGEANYKELTEDWAKANRIYQAGANVFNQIGNAVGLVTAGMEVIGGNVAKIGNALKIWGVIGEKAYSWMNPQPNLKGKFFNFVNTASEKANTIAMMVAIPIGISAAAIEINNSVGAVKKELDQEDPKDKNGNPITDKLGNPLKWEPGVTVPDPTKTVIAQEQSKADSKNIIEAILEDIFDGSD